MIDIFVGQDDRLPILSRTFEDEDGPIDLSGSAITIKLRKAGASTVVSGSMTPDPDQVNNKGVATYSWGATDTQVPGKWWAQFRVVVGGKTMTFPNTGAEKLWINKFWGG